MKIALKNVVDNPFRDLSRFPLRQDKVDKLAVSIKKNGWWENVVGRIVDGKLQIAYGHNRLAALRTLFSPEDELNFVVQDKTNAEMLQCMYAENDADYGSDLRSVIESVKATVQALADNQIKHSDFLIRLSPKTRPEWLRVAPSFVAGVSTPPGGVDKTYTMEMVADFLTSLKKKGEPSRRIIAAFAVLENMELGLWTLSTLKTLEDPSTGMLYARTVLKAATDCRERAAYSVEKAKVQVQSSTAVVQASQAVLNEERRKVAAERAAYDADVLRLADLAEKKSKADGERLAELTQEKLAKIEAAEPDRLRRAKELEEKLAAAKALETAAKKKLASAVAVAKQAPAALYLPHVTAAIKGFDALLSSGDLSKAARETLKDKALLTPEQRAAVKKAAVEAVARLEAFSKQF
jgi:hypothetical protein